MTEQDRPTPRLVVGDPVAQPLHIERAERPIAPEATSEELTRNTTVYIAVVALLAGLCVAFFAPDMVWDEWQGFVTLVALAIVFERYGVQIYGSATIYVGAIAFIAVGILFGPSGTAIAAPLVILCAGLLSRSAWYRVLFDMASYTLFAVAAALFIQWLPLGEVQVNMWWALAAIGGGAVAYVVNVTLVSIVLHLSTGERLIDVWKEDEAWLFAYYLVFGLLGLTLAAGYTALGVSGILAFVAPPLMMRFAFRQYVTKTETNVIELKQKNAELNAANRDITQMAQRLTETYNGTLEALVLALDARDRETKGHSLRVTEYAMAIARQLGMDERSQEWIDMQRGALLHDVGKIGVPDYILHKPGPLTPEEWDEMKRHPRIGHEMLHDIAFLEGAAAIVHAHHERFDGKGYPSGLAGDQIPLGARIFTVCDAFDAMTSDRPYRKGMPPELARDEILRNSGTQFDPEVVQAFLLVFDELAAKARAAREESGLEEARLATARAA